MLVETFIRASLHDETRIELGPPIRRKWAPKKKTAIIWTLRRWLRSEMLAVHQHYLKGFQPLYNHQRKCCHWWVLSENKKSKVYSAKMSVNRKNGRFIDRETDSLPIFKTSHRINEFQSSSKTRILTTFQTHEKCWLATKSALCDKSCNKVPNLLIPQFSTPM